MLKKGWPILIILMITLAPSLYLFLTRPKTGYLLIEEVYNNFEFKKEQENKFKIIKNERKKYLDSLELNLSLKEVEYRKKNIISNEEAFEFDKERKFYYQKVKQSEEDNEALRSQYDKEILTQLNQYVKNYGEENGYEYIFGNDNNGSLMYAVSKNNLSAEIIKYVNEKYKGVK